MWDDFTTTLASVIETMVQLDDESMRSGAYSSIQRHVEILKYKAHAEFDWDTAAMPLDHFRGFVTQRAAAQAERLRVCIATTLENLVGARVIGTFETHPENEEAGSYSYYRVVVESQYNGTRLDSRQEVRGRNLIEVTTNSESTTHSCFLERHEGHVFDLQVDPLAKTKVKMPGFISSFCKSIPSSLRPIVTVAHGEMIKHEVKRYKQWERTTGNVLSEDETIVSRGLMFDPAICIADFVLAGWSDADM